MLNSLQGKSGPNNPSGSAAPFGVGGFYGEGRYDYSIKEASGTSAANALDGTSVIAGQFVTGSVTYKDINFNQEFSASLA